MDRNGKFINGLNGLGEAYDGQDEAEVELAFQVQRGEPGDLSLLTALVERYAADVSRLASALLTQPGFPLPVDSDTQTVVLRTFSNAIRHTERFRGKTSLRNWLLSITIRQIAQYQRESRKRGLLRQSEEEISPAESTPATWESFDDLPEKLRITLILRYLCGLEVDDIKETLGARSKQAHDWLVDGRRMLMLEPPTSHRSDDLEAYVDGLLADDLTQRNELESHLPACQTCDAFLVRLRALDQQLREGLQKRWQLPALTSQDFERLAQMVIESLQAKQKWRLPAIPLKQVAWTAGLLVLFAVTTFYLIAHQPNVPEFAPRPTVTPTVLPVVEALQAVRSRDTSETPPGGSLRSRDTSETAPGGSLRSSDTSETPPGERLLFMGITSDLSGDGESIAFVSTKFDTTVASSMETSVSQQIYIYDKANGILLEVDGSKELPDSGNWLYSIPSISSDGRFLAYSQIGRTVNGSYDTCQSSDATPCPDIFVFDRQSGTTEQITHGAANGISLNPVISADGRWVAFWSMASNLTEDDSILCAADDGSQHCLDIFLYDGREDRTIRIPVGASLSTEHIGPDRISISADGSLVAFTAQADDQLNADLFFPHESQVFLYHREGGNYEMVNLAPDDYYGNGASSGAVLTPDGRYVAFTSLASDLVEGDTNGSFDVFVLDRENSTIERVSINTFGEEGNGDSGVFGGGTGFYSIDMSDDGRFVTFLSNATNFGSSENCNADTQELCNGVILHDRQTGHTEVIRSMETNHFALFVDISDDGRWVSYMDIITDCSLYQGACMETRLFDRIRGWTSTVSEALFPPVQPEWQRGSSIDALQEQIDVMAISQNGKYLAAAYGSNTIGMWNFTEQRWERTLQVNSDSPITSLAFDPGGEWLVAGTMDGVVKIWDVNGRSLYELKEHPGRVHTLLFTPDGSELMAGTPTEVWVWRRGEGKITLTNKLKYPETINSIALSPSGNLLAAASSDKTVWLQLLPSGSLISRLGGQENIVDNVTFSPDGNLLAASSLSGEIYLWKIDWKGFGALNTEFVTSIYDSNRFGKLAFSPDGRYLASGSYIYGIKLWDTHDGNLTNLYITEPSQGIVRSVTFTPDGTSILAGTFGEVEVWYTDLTVANPRYFKRYSSESFYRLAAGESSIIGDLPERLQTIGDAGSHLDLYQADELLPFDLLVPTHLPEQVHFMEAQLLQDGGAALRYQVENPSGTNAILYVLEYPATTREHAFPVGLKAQVVDVNLESTYAEYVQGDWVAVERQQPGSTPHETWQWEDTHSVQYLGWYDDQVFVTIYYQEQSTESRPGVGTSLDSPLLVGDWQPDYGLEQEDLVQIALGMEALPGYIPSDTVYVSYQIQEGDTCYGIAAYFGTSLEALVGLNKELGDCSLIRTGDVIMVPVNNARLDVDRADLDCDGQDERLQVVPALGIRGEALAYSVYLQAISDIGIHQDVWQLTAKGEESDYLSYPMLNQLYDCQIFVALKVIKAGVPELRVYRWVDGQMKPVLEAGMDILALDSYRNTMTVREQVVDPASGVCQPWDVTYEWNGELFVEIERIVDPTGGTCQ